MYLKSTQESKNFEILKISLKLPKIISSIIETIKIITNLPRDNLFNDFIVTELDSFSNDLDSLFNLVLKKSNLLERLRIGINQYYGKKKHAKKLKIKKNKTINYNYEIIDITIKLPKKLVNFVNSICELANIQKEYFFSTLIFTRLEYIYSDPEVLFSYIDGESGIYKELREGIEDYYENETVLK